MAKRYLSRMTLLWIILTIIFNHNLLSQTNSKDSTHISLSKAIEIALSDNPTIKIADRNVIIKRNYTKEQMITFFPDINGSASYSITLQKQKASMSIGGMPQTIEMGKPNSWNMGLSAQLPLVAAATWYNYKLSKSDVELALESAKSSKINLVNELKKAFYNYLMVKESHQVLLLNYQNSSSTLKNIEDKYNQGLASEFDKLRADVQVKNLIPKINSSTSNLELAEIMIKVLLGMDVKEPVVFVGSLKDYEVSMISKIMPDADTYSLSDNSDLKSLDINSRQLDIGIKLLKAASSPTLGLQTSWTYSINSDFKFNDYIRYPYSYVALGLQVPIMSWASTAYKIKNAKLNIINLNEQKQYLEDNLRVAIKNGITQIKLAKDELNSNKVTVELADKAYQIAKKQFDVGMATWLDLNASELALTSAKLSYNQSIYNYLSACADLDKILGVQ